MLSHTTGTTYNMHLTDIGYLLNSLLNPPIKASQILLFQYSHPRHLRFILKTGERSLIIFRIFATNILLQFNERIGLFEENDISHGVVRQIPSEKYPA